MWTLIFMVSYSFGQFQYGGPATIQGFSSEKECVYAAMVVTQQLPKDKIDWTRCVKVK